MFVTNPQICTIHHELYVIIYITLDILHILYYSISAIPVTESTLKIKLLN